MSKAVADTSIFIAQETGRELGELPEKVAVSVITVAELELGALRATDPEARARRLSTLSRVQSTYPLLPIGPEVASCFAASPQPSATAAAACVATTPGSQRRRCGMKLPSSLRILTLRPLTT